MGHQLCSPLEATLGLERHYKIHKNTVLRERRIGEKLYSAHWEEKENQISQVLNVLSKNPGLLNSLQ